MFEDFRKQAEQHSFGDEPEEEQDQTEVFTDQRFLGMTPPQRFLIALMLLIMAIILGGLFLVVTSKMVLPF